MPSKFATHQEFKEAFNSDPFKVGPAFNRFMEFFLSPRVDVYAYEAALATLIEQHYGLKDFRAAGAPATISDFMIQDGVMTEEEIIAVIMLCQR
jgi:hypothetical protein